MCCNEIETRFALPTKKQVVLGWVRSPKHYSSISVNIINIIIIVALEARQQEYRGNGFKVPICDMHIVRLFEYTTYYYNL